ncbi:putative Nudix hydrolase [Bacteroidia bacterium]|nr:putative Nudix hydrolase [Bacteroidia bacterium]
MTEFLDIYDENRNHIGVADRDVAHAFGLWHKTVHCWIVWRGNIVFQRRSRSLSDNPGKLYTTASGHVSAGESIEQAFAREISQEIGIEPENPRKISEIVWVGRYQKRGQPVIDRVFCNTFWGGYSGELSDFKFEDGEVDGVVAIDLSQFIDFVHGRSESVHGTEWDGEKFTELTLKVADFVLLDNEHIYTKYGSNAESIQRML